MPPQYMIEVKPKKQKRRNRQNRDLLATSFPENNNKFNKNFCNETNSSLKKTNCNNEKNLLGFFYYLNSRIFI